MAALNFPANPTNGQTYENYVYDGTDGVWKRISPGGTLGNIDDVTIDSPADGESLVYDSATGDWINADATVEVYGVDTTATDYFMIPVGGDADRPVTPANGHIRFNSDSGSPEWYSAANDQWVLFKEGPTIPIEYVVIAGGGAGGARAGAGGGAGGYRSNVSGESSGGGNSAESVLTVSSGVYTVQVGAGGAGVSDDGDGVIGSPGTVSNFSGITSSGGGYGGHAGGGRAVGGDGGSGGGGGGNAGGSGTLGQGFDGEIGTNTGGGGGGAGEAGGTDSTFQGGDGVSSSITGSSVTRGGGGGGSEYLGGGYAGGDGGGGAGGSTSGTAGTANTGGGGGGTGSSGPSGNGGSGIVIVKYPSTITATPTVGLTSITNTVGDYKVTTFTAGTGTVTFS